MSAGTLDTYETRTPDAEEWRGVPFRHPANRSVDDGGKHDGGPKPPEAPRDPAPSGGGGKSLPVPGARRASARRALGSGPSGVSQSPSADPVRA
ncbi:hypothetical protein ACIBBB_23750 [Streptomyces sp. NPDC051217]|uniref:hypothetical protein n=1 Tax=Streptomyces sp. NPDC051217 TaxID=3365644 RepID=UPI0037A7418D